MTIMAICPHCGQPEPAKTLETIVDATRTPQERLLIKVLARCEAKGVRPTREYLLDMLYAGCELPDNPSKALSQVLISTRRKLRPYGWTISKGHGGRAPDEYRLFREGEAA